ncbi:hypothetical protein L195_g023085 [Trifolium pratense]|uniref:Uncharacterized protein n=1 Tax=Trifolium pratense TaxID=57577 RepID=A0A2K3N9U5_TRIPR|nr:hypothetical protein L195_g023085 [Trifolium pratense]
MRRPVAEQLAIAATPARIVEGWSTVGHGRSNRDSQLLYFHGARSTFYGGSRRIGAVTWSSFVAIT